MTKYASIASLKLLIKPSDYDSIKDSLLAEESDNNISFEYRLNGLQLEGRNIAIKVEDICKKFSPSNLKDTLRAFWYECKQPTLISYAGILERDLGYYVDQYKKVSSLLKNGIITSSIPCLLVVNEQFFGKNFIFPHDFSLLDIVPKFSENVIVCVNLLKEEIKPIEYTFTTPILRRKNTSSSSHVTPQALDPQQAEIFFSSCSSVPAYKSYVANVSSKNRFFRNVSFYLLNGKIIQEYTKGSYCKEYDSLIEGSFAYLFGSREDFSTNGWSGLLSTQICFDLSSGVREQQTEIEAPIHIIQSNRLDIDQYLISDPQKLVEKSHVPGKPKIIVHSDPSWPEVFVSDGSFTKTVDFSCSYIDTRMHYKRVNSKKTFRFFIDAGNDIKNAYTITYWVINER